MIKHPFQDYQQYYFAVAAVVLQFCNKVNQALFLL